MGDKRKDYISWDEYFMGIATLSGMRSKEAVQMMSFHGTEMVKIISISIQLIVSLMRFLITEAEALIMPSFM